MGETEGLGWDELASCAGTLLKRRRTEACEAGRKELLRMHFTDLNVARHCWLAQRGSPLTDCQVKGSTQACTPCLPCPRCPIG